MLKLIEQTNEKNYMDFVEKYGKISDKNVAKQLLCVTSNAWFVLDESLKHDSEIIMYYQPMGILKGSVMEDVGGVFEEIYYSFIPQKGFKMAGNYQIPEFDLPDDFDIEAYILIQQKLLQNNVKFENSDIYFLGEKDMGEIINNITFDKSILYNIPSDLRFRGKEPNQIHTIYEIFDRSNLFNIIQENYLSANKESSKSK